MPSQPPVLESPDIDSPVLPSPAPASPSRSPLTLTALDRGPDELPVHVVETDDLRLAFLPTVGGRLVSLVCGGAELLWRNPEYLDDALRTVRPRSGWAPLDATMASWANVGGAKTWPAPQGWSGPLEWPGPPDAVLDAGEFAVDSRWDEDARELVVTLTSRDDARTGLRVTRELSVPERGTTFRQRTTFTNVTDRAVRWSVWEVAQVDTSAFAACGQGAVPDDAGLWVGVTGAAEPVGLVEEFGSLRVGRPNAGRRAVVVEDVVGKVGFTDADGTLALRRPDGAGIEWRVAMDDGKYPDGGCRVELWMQYPTAEPLGVGDLHPTAHLVELEALTPLTTLEPGASVEQRITWTVSPPRHPAGHPADS